jgi:hypothetical protein
VGRRACAVTVALVASLALAACGDDSDPGRSPDPATVDGAAPPAGVAPPPVETSTYEDMVAELEAHAATLVLPPGGTWPPPPPPPEPEPEPEPDPQGIMRGTEYGVGVGTSIADHYWWCAWAREWLAQRGIDPEREATALETLQQVRESHRYLVSMDSHSREWVDEMLERAALGDPGRLANVVELNCDT